MYLFELPVAFDMENTCTYIYYTTIILILV